MIQHFIYEGEKEKHYFIIPNAANKEIVISKNENLVVYFLDESMRDLLKRNHQVHIAKQTSQNRGKIQNRIEGTQSDQSNFTSPDHNSKKQNPTQFNS